MPPGASRRTSSGDPAAKRRDPEDASEPAVLDTIDLGITVALVVEARSHPVQAASGRPRAHDRRPPGGARWPRLAGLAAAAPALLLTAALVSHALVTPDAGQVRQAAPAATVSVAPDGPTPPPASPALPAPPASPAPAGSEEPAVGPLPGPYAPLPRRAATPAPRPAAATAPTPTAAAAPPPSPSVPAPQPSTTPVPTPTPTPVPTASPSATPTAT